jgi:dihydropteroate synthase type 2
MPRPLLVGIVNITADSFSDGGRFLDPAAAIAQARRLAADGADIVEFGAAASNVASGAVAPVEEIRRLDPVIAALAGTGVPLAVDTTQPETQRFALARGVAYLNDIRGFPDPCVYPDLAAGQCRLVVMHAVESEGRAQPVALTADEVWRRIEAFFGERVARLERAGIARERLILDPGMGLFLSTRPEASLRVLTSLDCLRHAFGLPIMISVSRKSFLGAITGRAAPAERGAASLAAELYAATNGADYIRTHEPAALRDALAVMEALTAESAHRANAKPKIRRSRSCRIPSGDRPASTGASSRQRGR